jgi:CPA2 family monovalent cation:H+ antiporter-2
MNVPAWELLFEIVTVLTVALFCAWIASRLRQRPIIGYLMAGVLVGPRSLGLVQSVETVQFLAELGVALLLFTIGLEFSFHRLAALGRQAIIGGFGQLVMTTGAGALLAVAFQLPAGQAFVLGAALALSSTAVVLRVLTDRAELDSVHGRGTLGILLFQDVSLVPLLIVISVVAEGKRGWQGMLDLGLSFAKAALLVGIFYLVIRLAISRVFRSQGHTERDLPVVLAVVVSIGCAGAAHSAGLSPAMGALVAGLLLADQPGAEQIRADVIPLRSVFVTLFFASIGMLATVPQGEALVLVPLIALAIIALKSVFAAIAVRLSRIPLGPSVQSGLALAQIGEFSFVLAGEATNKGILPRGTLDSLLSASVLTLLASPYLIAASARIAGWIERRSYSAFPQTPAPKIRPEVIVVGYGPAGQRVVEALVENRVPLLVLELNPDTVKNAPPAVPVYLGNAASEDILIHAGVEQVNAVIVTVPDPAVARMVVQHVKRLAPAAAILVRARYHLYVQALAEAGATAVVDEEDTVGVRLAEKAILCL